MTEELDKEVLDSVAEIDKLYTVFDGASQEDVAYAKVFWSSLSLQPPIESRLVSADIRQRLNVAKTPNYSALQHEELMSQPVEGSYGSLIKEESIAKKRDQIIALLKKQRDERIKREMISYRNKPRKGNLVEKKLAPKTLSSSVNEDRKEVQKLQ
ncbi:UPF0722 protein C11orf88 homolog [Sinocyclocheilus grahami]|uniref:UPF0722 protein C11orf88 homolog n=1 Tax=Sinocyclocheilus grahami TaxID=75366 RepID=UPI0007ACF61B|nr:PREDICTED: UPF0722 protein C11orf88 homolog [Sinocyclocheilus grahami]